MPEGVPLYGTLCEASEEYWIPGVKPGVYYVMATSVAWKMNATDILIPHHTLRTRSKEPFHVNGDFAEEKRDVHLYPPRLDDPPILVSLSLLMNNFLKRQVGDRNRKEIRWRRPCYSEGNHEIEEDVYDDYRDESVPYF